MDKRLIQELTACGQQVAFKYALIRGTTPLLDFVVENMIQLDQVIECVANMRTHFSYMFSEYVRTPN